MARLREIGWARRAASAAGAFWIRLVQGTTRWTEEGTEALDAAIRSPDPHMIFVWHGRVIMIPSERAREGAVVHALISANRDGDMIADCVARFGVPSIRGSAKDPRKPDKDKGGREAAKAVREVLASGALVAATPDGPRGPRGRMQPGMAALALLSRATVVPYAFATRRAIVFGSWDRFMLPLPFGRGAKVAGPAVPPPQARSEDALEAHRLALEAALNAATARADELAGRRAPIAPTAASP
ncbi:MAG: lysophospholipid acyltransferase family protein [Pseudomonadota bacterium]